MELMQLKIFLSAAKHLNFTRVADSMFLSQPSVSKYISGLENELGEPLFIRTRKSLKLTQFGELFLPKAKEIVDKIDELQNFTQQFRSDSQNAIVCGIGTGLLEGTNLVLYNALVSASAEMKYRYPDTTLRLKVHSPKEIPLMLYEDRIDCGIMPLDSSDIDEYLVEHCHLLLLRKSVFYLATPTRLGHHKSLEDIVKSIDTLFYMSSGVDWPIIEGLQRNYGINACMQSCDYPNELLLRVIFEEGAGVMEEALRPFLEYCQIPFYPLSNQGTDIGLYALRKQGKVYDKLEKNRQIISFESILTERLNNEKWAASASHLR